MTICLLGYCDDNLSPQYPVLFKQSPNVYSYPIYGDVPVDYYTGAMHYSIPIYEIVVDGCRIPISLEYVGNGIKVSQDASNVGLGWFLNCGGIISSDSYGSDDFDYQGGYLNTMFPEGIPADNVLYRYQKNNMPGYNILAWDTRPDIYHYAFSGFSGTMVFPRNNRHVPKILNPQSYLDFYYQNDARHWVVYDAYGNRYSFGNWAHESAHGVSWHYTPTTEGGGSLTTMDDPSSVIVDWNFRSVNAWPIDTIITNNGHQILFSYHYESIRTPVLSREEIRIVPQRVNPNILFQHCDICTSSMVESHHSEEIKQAVIDQISFPGGTIHFYSSTRNDIWEGGLGNPNPVSPTKLDSIIVRSGTKVLKKVGFHYHYMGQSNTPNTCRLVLDSVTGLLPKPYKFSYYTEELPKKNSRQIDMWGFYNNSQAPQEWGIHSSAKNNEGTLVPTMEIGNMYYYGRNRNPNPLVQTNAMLKSVVYPTGGKTIFVYEPNSFTPSTTDAECIDSVASVHALSLIHSINYTISPAGMSLQTPAGYWTYHLDSTDVLDAYITHNSIWSGAQQPTIIAYVHLRNSDGNTICREPLYFHEKNTVNDWHFRLNGQYPSGEYTLTLEDAQNTAIFMEPPSYPTNSGSIITQATITQSKHSPIGNKLTFGAGLRIASIQHYDKNDTLIRKHDFTYKKTGNASSGILMVPPRYHTPFSEEFLSHEYPDVLPNSDCFPALGFLISSDMLRSPNPMIYSTSVGYSQVRETISSNSPHGGTEYIFYNQICDSVETWPGYICLGKEQNGELLQKSIFDASNHIVEKENYTYLRRLLSEIKGLQYFEVFPPRYYSAGNQEVNNVMLNPYAIRQVQKTEETIIKTSYLENGDSIVATTQIALDSILMLPTQSKVYINSDTVRQSFIYAANDSIHAQSLLYAHYPGAILNAVKTENGQTQDITSYQYSISNNHGVLTDEYHCKNNNAPDTVRTYHASSFDAYCNPTTIENSLQVPVAYLWGCNQTQPILQAIGITNDQLLSCLNIGFVSMLRSSCDVPKQMLKSVHTAVTSAFPHAEVSARSYIPGIGVSYEISPRGIIYIYEYDKYGRLTTISREVNGEQRIIERYDYHLSGE